MDIAGFEWVLALGGPRYLVRWMCDRQDRQSGWLSGDEDNQGVSLVGSVVHLDR